MSDRARLVSLSDRGVPGTAPPPGALVDVLEAPDGKLLRTATWEPIGPVRGTVLVLHGYTEFIEKYYEVVERLLARDFAVVTYDHRGQGLSDRLLPSLRGYQTSFEDLVSDAIRVHDTLAARRPGPQILLAHSMGGNVALRMLQQEPGRFDRAALSAPMAGFKLPLWLMRAVSSAYVAVGRGDRTIWGDAEEEEGAEPENRVTTCAARYARAHAFWQAEPSLVVSGLTWRWVREASRSVVQVARAEELAKLEIPILLASAGNDLVVSSSHHEALERRAPRIERALLADSMHEILQETEAIQQLFWDRFDAFTAGVGVAPAEQATTA